MVSLFITNQALIKEAYRIIHQVWHILLNVDILYIFKHIRVELSWSSPSTNRSLSLSRVERKVSLGDI